MGGLPLCDSVEFSVVLLSFEGDRHAVGVLKEVCVCDVVESFSVFEESDVSDGELFSAFV